MLARFFFDNPAPRDAKFLSDGEASFLHGAERPEGKGSEGDFVTWRDDARR